MRYGVKVRVRATFPVGLCGEFRISILVFCVIALQIIKVRVTVRVRVGNINSKRT
jgi:hypothetical protein